MDPILIGTAVSEHVIKEMSCTIGQSAVTNDYLINIHDYVERRKQASTASSLTP